eukprot:c20967_g4_i3.p1 GENE.c20967_g4_i3~~c20967_g4_i3.p1  ORF type:complete len:334 (+),score=118.17 c20967_g4_i3:60-1004(+)
MKYVHLLIFLAFSCESLFGGIINTLKEKDQIEKNTQKQESSMGGSVEMGMGMGVVLPTQSNSPSSSPLPSPSASSQQQQQGMGMGMGANPAPAPDAMGMGMGMAPCVPTVNVTDLSVLLFNNTHGNSLSIYSCDGKKLLAVVPPGVANYSVCLPPDLRFSYTVGGGMIKPEVGWGITDLTNSGTRLPALGVSIPPFSRKSVACLNCPPNANANATYVEVYFYMGSINSFQFSDCSNNTVFNYALPDYSAFPSNGTSSEVFTACLPNNGGTIRSNTGAPFYIYLVTPNGELIFEAEAGNGVASGGCGGQGKSYQN